MRSNANNYYFRRLLYYIPLPLKDHFSMRLDDLSERLHEGRWSVHTPPERVGGRLHLNHLGDACAVGMT